MVGLRSVTGGFTQNVRPYGRNSTVEVEIDREGDAADAYLGG